MKFSKYVFTIAGVWGLLVTIPQYFGEAKYGIDNPPPVNHPEFYYGFAGLVLAWQVLFLTIALDPIRYRPVMFAAIVEKGAFAIAIPILYLQGRVGSTMLFASFIDLVLGILFVISYLKTPQRQFTYEV